MPKTQLEFDAGVRVGVLYKRITSVSGGKVIAKEITDAVTFVFVPLAASEALNKRPLGIALLAEMEQSPWMVCQSGTLYK